MADQDEIINDMNETPIDETPADGASWLDTCGAAESQDGAPEVDPQDDTEAETDQWSQESRLIS